jgi:hypothetical protein
MSQRKKLICGGLFLILGSTHAGCAGSGLKNMFTRNETDGYHSLDELEAQEAGQEEETPSIATRLASWHPFGSARSDEADTSATDETRLSEAEKIDKARSTLFPGLALSKRDSVAPDPFLGAESKHATGTGTSIADISVDSTIAKTDKNRSATGETTKAATEPSLNPESRKESDTGIKQVRHQAEPDDAKAEALGASRKSGSNVRHDKDDDDALAKRFEQHFLLNSVGTVAKIDGDTHSPENSPLQKSQADAEKASLKKRDVAGIAERQIDQFEHVMASRQGDSADEKPANSLFAFDQLMDSTSSSNRTTLTSDTSTHKEAALDINVADAEALFGAAAARQNSIAGQGADDPGQSPSDHRAARNSAWSQTQDKSGEFQWNGSRSVKTVSQAEDFSGDVTDAFDQFSESQAGPGRRAHNTAFGAPEVSAGSIDRDDPSVINTADIRLSNASGSGADRQIVTANYGIAPQKVVINPAATEASVIDDAEFTFATAAPVAPVAIVPELSASSEATAQTARPGLVQSFSTRNWLLLIGGIIVIALLFAPARTKPLTMNH